MEEQEILQTEETAETAETTEPGGENPAWELLLRQRDEAIRDADRLRAELEDSRRVQYLTMRGVPAAEAGYVAGLLRGEVTEACSFEAAAERWLRRHAEKQTRVDLTAPVGGGGETPSPGDAMNRLLREARRR